MERPPPGARRDAEVPPKDPRQIGRVAEPAANRDIGEQSIAACLKFPRAFHTLRRPESIIEGPD
jgi:hypothetical protein